MVILVNEPTFLAPHFTTYVTPHYKTSGVQPFTTYVQVFQESKLSEGFRTLRQSGSREEAAKKPGPGQPSVLQVQTWSPVPSSFYNTAHQKLSSKLCLTHFHWTKDFLQVGLLLVKARAGKTIQDGSVLPCDPRAWVRTRRDNPTCQAIRKKSEFKA